MVPTRNIPLLLVPLFVLSCAPGLPDLRERRPQLIPRASAHVVSPEAATGGLESAPFERLEGDLSTLTAVLLSSSPAIEEARNRYEAARARVPRASRLPNTRIEYMPMSASTTTAPGMHSVRLTQMIPFPTTISAERSSAQAEARRAYLIYDREVRDAIVRLTMMVADLYYVARALEVVEQNEELARLLSTLGASRYAENTGTLFDAVRAEAQLAELAYDRVILRERLVTVQARLNALLGRPAMAPITPPVALPRFDLSITSEELFAQALESSQELRIADEEIRIASARRGLALSSWAPDLMLGGIVMFPWPLPDQAQSQESRAHYGVMAGISLPLSFHANAAAVREADANLRASLWAKDRARGELEADIVEALARYRNAVRLMQLYEEHLLPRVQQTLLNAERFHRGDEANYSDLLEARALFYSFSLARDRAVADHVQAVAQLEQLVGAAFGPAPVAPEEEP